MTEQEIQARIEKKNKDIEKINKRIAKWSKGMSEEAKQMAQRCEITPADPNYKSVCREVIEYGEAHKNDPKVFYQGYSIGVAPDFAELRRAYVDLAAQKATLAKYQTQLTKQSSFNASEKIPVIWDFLQEWRQKAYKYFIENVALYAQLKMEEDKAFDDYKQTSAYKDVINAAPKTEYARTRAQLHLRYQFLGDYYSAISAVTKDIYLYKGKWDDAKLNKILDKDVQHKYENFIARITEKAGNIEDVNNLHISENGEINGVVKGDKHSVKVETIGAGGYNIQCFHFRVLVNIIE